jgi:hypothetical protein
MSTEIPKVDNKNRGLPEEAFNRVTSELRYLEAMADVVMTEPEGLCHGTLEMLKAGVYFGLMRVRNEMIDAHSAAVVKG